MPFYLRHFSVLSQLEISDQNGAIVLVTIDGRAMLRIRHEVLYSFAFVLPIQLQVLSNYFPTLFYGTTNFTSIKITEKPQEFQLKEN